MGKQPMLFGVLANSLSRCLRSQVSALINYGSELRKTTQTEIKTAMYKMRVHRDWDKTVEFGGQNRDKTKTEKIKKMSVQKRRPCALLRFKRSRICCYTY